MKRLFLVLLLILVFSTSYAAQKTITVGTSGSKASLDTNFGNAQDNFTELYTAEGKAVQSWADDTAYALGRQVFVGADGYTCITPHLSVEALTKPGTGSAWEDAWELTGHLLSAADLAKLGNVPADTNSVLSGKQATLVSGTNIKTINGTSVLGSGDLTVVGGDGAAIDDTAGSGDTTVVYSAGHIADTYQPIANVVEGAVGTGLTGTLTDGVYTISVTPYTYQPYDTTTINKAAIDTQNKFETLLGWTIPSGSFAFDTFPDYEDSAHSSGIAVNGTTLAVYSSTAGKWLTASLTDSLDPSPTTYSLTVDMVDGNGTDLFTYSSTDYTTDQIFTGLTSDATFTVTADTGREVACTGSGLTDNTGGSYTANTDSANVTAECTYSASSSATLLAYYKFDEAYNSGWYEEENAAYQGTQTGTVTYTASGGQSGGYISTTLTNSYVGIPVQSILAGVGTFTIQYYMNVTGSITGGNQESGLYYTSGGNGNDLHLYVEDWGNGAKIVFTEGWSDTASVSNLSGYALSPDTWYKIELIVDFPNNTISYYQNDNLVGSVTDAVAITQWTLDTTLLFIGTKITSSPTVKIDEYKIFSGSTH